MKKFAPPYFSKFNFEFAIFLLFFTLTTIPAKIMAQSGNCGVDVPDGFMEAMIDEVPLIEQFAAQRGPVSMQDVPVRISVFHGPDSWFADLNFSLDDLNSAFAPAGLNFINCAPLNEIWDDRIAQGVGSTVNPGLLVDQFFPLFSYTSSAMEVYMNILGGDPTAVVPLPAYQSGNPNYVPAYPYQYSNWINMKGCTACPAFIHEVGHHFGLLHTFHPNKYYDVPVIDENTPDYPYKVFIPNTNELQPWWWGRELVIRSDVPQGLKTFHLKNYDIAGDLIEDTPADCYVDGNPLLFPGCPSSAQDPVTCEFNSTLTYEDYNGDAIYPPPAYSLGRNYMSYWRLICRNEFTPLQNIRIGYYYENAREPIHALNKCGNFTDKVEFEGSNLGLHNVTARVRHTSDSRICNVTTDEDGDFGGILHADDLKSYIYHNGQKNTLEYPGDPLRIHYDHTPCEWLSGVSTFDLTLISKHILNIQPFINGYSKIAADANKSNSVTTFDIVELRKLILGIYDELPNHDQPWRYIPEFIPQDYAIDFDFNPYNITIGGGSAYLEQGWQFTLTDAQNGKKGFDGIKIGDVNSSWPLSPDCPNEDDPQEDTGEKPTLTVPTTPLAQDQVVALTFRANNFEQVEAFQLGIRLPYEYFDLQDVTNTTLPAYTATDNFGLTKLAENAIRTSWFDETGNVQSLQNNSILFSLVVSAKQPIANLQSVLKLDNSILPSQFWRVGTVTTGPVSLTISVEQVEERTDNQTSGDFPQTSDESFYCTPNPFKSNVQLTFVHKGQPTQGILQITNMHGIEIHTQEISMLTGQNTLETNVLKNVPSGIYWINLNIKGKTYTAKVVKE